MNIDALLGLTMDHLTAIEGTKHFVHAQVLPDFLRLQRAALEHGFELRIISSFRSRERQLKIWNEKVLGVRPVHDESGVPLDVSLLSPSELMISILRWSALPGASRHHWGTDIDVFDARTQQESEVKLSAAETADDGPASRMHDWLDDHLNEFNFFRPYSSDRGGVSPERWHLSHQPNARRMMENYSLSLFRKNVDELEIELKKEILEHADLIFHKFFLNIDQP